MKIKKSNFRYRLLLLILASYFLPLIILISYNILIENGSKDWTLLSSGLLLAATGSLILFWAVGKRESSLKAMPNITFFEKNGILAQNDAWDNDFESKDAKEIEPKEFEFMKRSLAEAQQMQIRLLDEIDNLAAELQTAKADKTSTQKSHEKFISQTEEERSSFSKQLEEQQSHIRSLHQTLAEQKTILEKKELHASSLESKVGDLTYEIKTLLQLAEAHNSSLFNLNPEDTSLNAAQETKVPQAISATPQEKNTLYTKTESSNDASSQLKRCISIAQKITGSHRFGSQLYSTIESPVESFAIDLRRLCDRLRLDIVNANSTVLLYSPREGQLLFSGNQIRDLTGWSPEKFTQTFNEVLIDEEAWKSSISSLSMRSEAKTPLSFKTRSGQTVQFQTHLGMIPTGIFRNYVIALLVQN